jgi:hypothetical protein
VITGYNTHVRHNNRIFHVQTEDKGESSPEIESLVYLGGEILATRRSSYADAVRAGRDDRVVQELLEQQHRTMVASIQGGGFDGPDGSVRVPEGFSAAVDVLSPGGAAAAAEPTTAGDRSLDQVILEYLAAMMTLEQIECSFTPVPDLVGGREAALRLRARSSQSKQAVEGATVQVRHLTSAGKGSVVFQGTTGADGACPISFRVPEPPDGDAAAVIRVKSPIGSTEFRFPVRKNP